jgi:hypothetical protein
MNKKDFTMADLGVLEDEFNKIIAHYKVEDKKEQIFEYLKKEIFEEISDIDLALIFGKDFKLNFATASGLAYRLKKEIIERKLELPAFAEKLVDKYWSKDKPNVIADDILNEIKFDIKDEVIQKRYQQAVLSWIKEVRKNADLKDVLIRVEKVGGVGMDDKQAEQVIKLLESKKKEIEKDKINLAKVILDYEEKGYAPDTAIEESEIDVEAKPELAKAKENLTGEDITIDTLLQTKGVDYKDLAKKEPLRQEIQKESSFAEASEDKDVNLAESIQAKEEKLEAKPELAPPPPVKVAAVKETEFKDFDFDDNLPKQDTVEMEKEAVLDKEAQIRQTIAQQPSQSKVVPPKQAVPEIPAQPQKQPEPVAQQPMIKKTEDQGQRPRLDDVKFSPKLFGPIEELADLKIADFRRLSKDPNEAVNKIIGKLDLLEDESIIKRVEGIKALKQSPLYKDYADIMNQAIKQGRSPEEIIKQNPTINMEEFKAIVDLNKNLKY